MNAIIPNRCKTTKRKAFSLTELLVVMAVIAIVTAGTANVFSSFRDNDQKKALIHIANAIELARQMAVSRNTYTYVAFTTPENPQDTGTPLCVAVFQSSAGDDIVKRGEPLSPEASASGQDGWLLIAKPQWLRNAVLDNTKTKLADLPELAPVLSQNTVSYIPDAESAFEITRQMGNMPAKGPLRFDRMITFSPNGLAIVDNKTGLPASTIGFMVRPSRNASPSEIEKLQSAAILVSGLMGNVQIVHR